MKSQNRSLYVLAKSRSRSVGSRGRVNRKGNFGVTIHTHTKGQRFTQQVARAKRVYKGKGRPPQRLTFQTGKRSNKIKNTRKNMTPQQRAALRKRSLLPKAARGAIGVTGKSTPRTPQVNVTYRSHTVNQRGLINAGSVTNNNSRYTANFRMNTAIKVGATLGAGGLGITYIANQNNGKRKKRQ